MRNKIKIFLSLSSCILVLISCATSHNKNIENKSPDADEQKAKQYETGNYQPFFDYTYDGEKNITRYNILGPFITIEKEAQKEEKIFRPFYSKTEDKKDDTSDVDVIYPLGKYKRNSEESSSRFTPLFTSRKEFKETEGKKRDFGFFPVFWGQTEEGEGYGGLFPIYGDMRKRFGKDEIKFVLWPIYARTRDDKTVNKDFIWPIFSTITGEKESGFRMWPLFGYKEKEGEYSKKFFLWPLIHYQNTDLDTSRPKKYRAFLPLYASETSPNRVTKSIIWPFFNYLHDDDENLTLWDFPWPIIQKGKGDNLNVFKVFPIYGYRDKEHLNERFFLWPLYTYKREYPEDSEKIVHRFLLISKYEYETSANKTPNSELRTPNSFQLRLWPLFNYKSKKDGETIFHFPEIIPIETEGFEKNYAPIFRLYEYDSNIKGEMESKLLWGLYSHKKNDFGEFIDLSFLISYEKRGDGGSFSILKGLLELGKKNGKSYFKVLYIPF
ncbi:MAG: hypothetical protein HZA00_02455 [Nitrospinae bacterium]|nr:hypothetical protein [Nitrospinota bacterium]